MPSRPKPRVTICVLTYGDFLPLTRRCLDSIRRNLPRSQYRLVVGANAVSPACRRFLTGLRQRGAIDRLVDSRANLNKCPMMRRMFEGIDTEYIWWLDDDSYLEQATALTDRLAVADAAGPDTVLWGHQFYFGHERDFSYGTDVVGFVRRAPWFRGLAPPSWEPGGKGELDFEGRGCGDGRWFFVTGGCWLIRTAAVRALDWPDPRLVKRNDDVFLSEAVRQQGWRQQDIGPCGVAINAAPRRGGGEDAATMRFQVEAANEGLELDGWFDEKEAEAYRSLVSRIRDGIVVEVGVWKGRSLSAILDVCRLNNNRVVAVDRWRPVRGDRTYAEAAGRDVRRVFERNLELLGHRPTVEIVQAGSVVAARRFADTSVDLVFLDADHAYESVRRDIRAWLPKLKPGGVLCGHDYTDHEGVRRAVDEQFADRLELLGGSVWCVGPPKGSPPGRGCVFVPTFRDTQRLRDNFDGRRGVLGAIEVFVYDDNDDPAECAAVRALCEANEWTYRPSGRRGHGSWEEESADLSGYNRFVWQSMIELAAEYDYVVKCDTDTLVLEPNWFHEFAHALVGKKAMMGTPEVRPRADVQAWWDLAGAAGYDEVPGDYVTHLQGGLYGASQEALRALRDMGFLAGEHAGVADDGYLSYSCQVLGIPLLSARTVGAWWRHYRPSLSLLSNLRAIHPLSRVEWGTFRSRECRPRLAPLDPAGWRCPELSSRPHQVRRSQLATPIEDLAGGAAVLRSLPGTGAGSHLRAVIRTLAEAVQGGHPVGLGLGSQVIAGGLGSLLVGLIERGWVSWIALTEQAAIHDYEWCLVGEAVALAAIDAQGRKGSVGTAEEVVEAFSTASIDGRAKGLGRALGELMEERSYPHRDLSVLATCARQGLPAMIQVEVGADLLHAAPDLPADALGAASIFDFRQFVAAMGQLGEGVWLNLGEPRLEGWLTRVLAGAPGLGMGVGPFTAVSLQVAGWAGEEGDSVGPSGVRRLRLSGPLEVNFPLLQTGWCSLLSGHAIDRAGLD